MIILFNKNEKKFDTLGLGVLRDAVYCSVTEELNESFELEMEYPITGSHYSDISLQKILLARPNMYERAQPFRIYSITKPINGRVIINAEHISYDTTGYIVKPFENKEINDVIDIIQNQAFPNSPFKFYTDKIAKDVLMSTDKPYSQRALLAGQSGSILDTFGGEYKFDRYDIHLLNDRGINRGVTIRYGKNLINLENETSSSKLYTGIFPFYSSNTSSTPTFTEKYYKEAYIVPDTIVYTPLWLTLTKGMIPITPMVENAPVQIESEDEYYNGKVCHFKYAKSGVNFFDVYIRNNSVEYGADWLSETENGPALIPKIRTLYKIINGTEFINRTYAWTGTEYIRLTTLGFYYLYEEEGEEPPEPNLTRISGGEVENETIYIDLTNDPDLSNGIIFVEGQENADPHKILNLDLTDQFPDPPDEIKLKAKAEDYLKNTKLQEINESITVSFIKLSDTTEYSYFKELEKVTLGDWINVYYEKLGVDATLQVIRTEFDVLSEKYNEIELGKKSAKLSDNALTAGDGVSSLVNDANFTDKISVVHLLAQNITADYITASKASFTEVQIKELESDNIITTLLSASQAKIDQLVATLLVTDNALIKDALVAGTIEVQGNITAHSGNIGGCLIKDGRLLVSTEIQIGYDEDEQKYNFKVDHEGNVTASSLTIVGGAITLGRYSYTEGSYPFMVDREGNVTAKSFTFYQNGTSIINGKISTPDISFTKGVRLTAQESGTYRKHFIKLTMSQITSPNNQIYLRTTLIIEDEDGNVLPDDLTFQSQTITLYSNFTFIPNMGGKPQPNSATIKMVIPKGLKSGLGQTWIIKPEPEDKPGTMILNDYYCTPNIYEEWTGEPGDLISEADIIPYEKDKFDLGSSSNRWKDIHAQTTYTNITTTTILMSTNLESGSNNIMSASNLIPFLSSSLTIGNSTWKWGAIYATDIYATDIYIKNTVGGDTDLKVKIKELEDRIRTLELK